MLLLTTESFSLLCTLSSFHAHPAYRRQGIKGHLPATSWGTDVLKHSHGLFQKMSDCTVIALSWQLNSFIVQSVGPLSFCHSFQHSSHPLKKLETNLGTKITKKVDPSTSQTGHYRGVCFLA